MPRTAIVIPAYNEAKRIGMTLGSLRMQEGAIDPAEHSIVVVDNNSTDETVTIVNLPIY